jgi:hypothetical protein
MSGKAVRVRQQPGTAITARMDVIDFSYLPQVLAVAHEDKEDTGPVFTGPEAAGMLATIPEDPADTTEDEGSETGSLDADDEAQKIGSYLAGLHYGTTPQEQERNMSILRVRGQHWITHLLVQGEALWYAAAYTYPSFCVFACRTATRL